MYNQGGFVAGNSANFPIAFSKALAISSSISVSKQDNDTATSVGVLSFTTTGFSMFNWYIPSNGFHWMAIGI